ADFLIAEHAKEFAEAGERLFEQAADHVVGGVAGADTRTAVEQNQANLREGGEFVEGGGDLIRLVPDETVGGDYMPLLGHFPLNVVAVDVGFGGAGVADGDNGDGDGVVPGFGA